MRPFLYFIFTIIDITGWVCIYEYQLHHRYKPIYNNKRKQLIQDAVSYYFKLYNNAKNGVYRFYPLAKEIKKHLQTKFRDAFLILSDLFLRNILQYFECEFPEFLYGRNIDFFIR